MCQAQRLFRAKVVGLGRANLLVLSKKHWLKLLDDDDVDAYLKLCKDYTDIAKDGQDLVQEMQTKKRLVKAFLDGASANIANKNARSQDTDLSWLSHKSHGLKA